MTRFAFMRTVLSLWSDHWQGPLRILLAKYGHSYTRQTFWNWKTGASPVPEPVAVILKAEEKRRKTTENGTES